MEATMAVRMDASEKALIADYARILGTSASQFMRSCTLDRIEDEIDAEAYMKAKAAYDADPASCTLDEAERMLGL